MHQVCWTWIVLYNSKYSIRDYPLLKNVRKTYFVENFYSFLREFQLTEPRDPSFKITDEQSFRCKFASSSSRAVLLESQQFATWLINLMADCTTPHPLLFAQERRDHLLTPFIIAHCSVQVIGVICRQNWGKPWLASLIKLAMTKQFCLPFRINSAWKSMPFFMCCDRFSKFIIYI